MATIAVRCAGGGGCADVRTGQVVACGWTGEVEPDWEVVDDPLATSDHPPEFDAAAQHAAVRFGLGCCPNCRGALEPVKPSGTEAQGGGTIGASAPEVSQEIREDWRVIEPTTPGPMEAVALGSEGYAVRPSVGDLRQRARVAMCGYRAWEEDKANAAFIARAWTRWPQLLTEVDDLRAIELAAVALLQASGPDASRGDHETAERVLRGLLVARGHEVGEGTA